MDYNLDTREKIEQFIISEVLTTSEVMQILDISRQRISQLIKSDKLVPIKKLRGDSLFLREDINRKKVELEEARKKYRPYDN